MQRNQNGGEGPAGEGAESGETAGVIGANGRFISPEKSGVPAKLKDRLVQRDGKTVFLLTDDVWLTQKDIRQVQLAKGAVRAGSTSFFATPGLWLPPSTRC